MSEKISVVMASYNGMPYIKKQVETILKNLNADDELVVSDDYSNDGTLEFLKEVENVDSRVRVLEGPKKDIKENFRNAIINAQGEYVFLADQDDIWLDNKVKTIIKAFKENEDAVVIVHDNIVVDSNENVIYNSYFKFRNCGKGIIKNIYKNTYIGCCMAFKGEMKEKILRMPNNILMHDQWIGIIGELYGESVFLNDKLMLYRRHGNNNSSFKHYPINIMLKNRIIFIYEFVKYYFKYYLKEK